MDPRTANPIEDYSGSAPESNGGNPNANHVDEGRDTKPSGASPQIAGFDLRDPGDIFDVGGDPADSQPRRRGRKPGSKNKPRDAQEKTTGNIAENLERLLLSVHTMGAAFLSCPELEIDPEEAKTLARAIRDVSKFYPVTLDPKRLALIELGTIAAMIYGTRGVAIYRRVTSEAKPKKPVVVMNPTPKSEPKPAPPNNAPQNVKPNGTAPPSPEKRILMPSDLFGSETGVDDNPEF